jgi:hypothetical protein
VSENKNISLYTKSNERISDNLDDYLGQYIKLRMGEHEYKIKLIRKI